MPIFTATVEITAPSGRVTERSFDAIEADPVRFGLAAFDVVEWTERRSTREISVYAQIDIYDDGPAWTVDDVGLAEWGRSAIKARLDRIAVFGRATYRVIGDVDVLGAAL